jgi:hypothetical protein
MWYSWWRFDINFASVVARFFLTLGWMETILPKHSWLPLLLLLIVWILDLLSHERRWNFSYLIGLFLIDFLWFVNYWFFHFVFWGLNSKIIYTLIILLLDRLHKLPLSAIFGFICYSLIFHHFANFSLLFLLFRICEFLHLRWLKLGRYNGVVIFLFYHTCNILRSELSV